MAKQIIQKLLDDLDGGEADETIVFALDGYAYEIDLSAKNANKLRTFLATYQEAGTRTGRVGSPPSLKSSYGARSGVPSLANNREHNQRIRAWALENGYELSERGRIPQYIVDAFGTNTPNPQLAALEAELEQEPEPVAEAPKPRKRAVKAAFSAAK